jgi:hypothetical protein
MQEGQIHSNHAYSLWCLEHERAHRTAESEWGRKGCPIRILVRSQYHGFQERGQSAPLFVHLGLKLEWSSQFGAEMTTLSETTRDWVALTFRPEATLLRARVNPKSLQVCKTIKIYFIDCKTLSNSGYADRGERLKSAVLRGSSPWTGCAKNLQCLTLGNIRTDVPG